MILKLSIYIFSIIVFASCKSANNECELDFTKYQGWWISTTIADSTIMERTIYGKHSFIVQDATMFEIKNDTINTYGSIINKMGFPIYGSNDTIAIIRGMAEAHIIANNETILATTNRRNEEYRELFRRATKDEQKQLIRNISKTNTIAKNLEIWFAEKILSGTYVDENDQLIKLSKDRKCKGFKKYNHFETHFTDGTLDWMRNDWIRFSDTISNESIIYHFKFENDKLKLYNYNMIEVENQWEIGKLNSTWTRKNK